MEITRNSRNVFASSSTCQQSCKSFLIFYFFCVVNEADIIFQTNRKKIRSTTSSSTLLPLSARARLKIPRSTATHYRQAPWIIKQCNKLPRFVTHIFLCDILLNSLWRRKPNRQIGKTSFTKSEPPAKKHHAKNIKGKCTINGIQVCRRKSKRRLEHSQIRK